MRNIQRIHGSVIWVVFVLFTVACVIYVYYNFEKANSLVTLEITMDRSAALDKAGQLALEFSIGPENYKQTAAFRNDRRFQNYVELEAGGVEKFTEIIDTGFYHSYHWTVRHFEELNPHEVSFWFAPNGESLGFYEKIPESVKGAALLTEEAQKIAEHHALYNWDVDLFTYKLVEKSKEEQISGRIDHKFVYERTDISLGEATYRLTLVVSGDRLTAVDYTTKIPENFDRRYSEMRSSNETIQIISTAIIFLIYGLLGVVAAIFILIRTRRLIWKPAVFWGMAITFFSVFLVSLNSLPFSWFSYDTSSSQSNFLFRFLFNGLAGAIGFGAVISLSFMAGEGLGRLAFPKHIQWWRIWSNKSGGSLTILQQTISGYFLAVVIVAFDVAYYVITTNHFGWWSPAGTLSNPNILATYLPWLDSIAISLQAGFWEEALFRAVPIAGVFVLTKNKKSRNFWVIIILFLQSLVFGAAHANYPQQPSYARVLEMIIPFVIMGLVYIYFGILPAVIAHFTIDVFWISLPLWVSTAGGIWIDRSLVLLFLFLPLLIVFYFRLKKKSWSKIPLSERNAGWHKQAASEPETLENFKIQNTVKDYSKLLIPMGLAGLILWFVFTPFKNDAPLLDLNKQNAIETAKKALAKQYDLNFNDWTILSGVSDKVDIRDIFIWNEGKKESYDSLLNNFLAPPHWQIRLVKTSGKAEEKTEEFRVFIKNSGEVFQISHKIPENRQGENLNQKQAQQKVDSILQKNYQLSRQKLKEISVSPTRQKNRTDWEFIYADTRSYPLEKGQGRILVQLAGDEITETFSYVHVPEEWIRDFKQESSVKSIFRAVGGIFVFGIICLGLVLAIIRWTQKKFNISVFAGYTVLFAVLFAGEVILNWSSFFSEYSTELPMKNFIISVVISISITGVFFSLAHGIFIAATPGWILVQPNRKSRTNAVFLGFLMVGMLAISNRVLPETEPFWIDQSYVNGEIPWLSLMFMNMQNIILYPAFAWIFYLAIQHFTEGWQNSKWIAFVLSLMAGLSVSALSFVNVHTWLITGLIIGTLLLGIYIYFVYNHFEYIPFAFGFIAISETLQQIIILNHPWTYLSGFLMILFSSVILFYWQKLILRVESDKNHN